MKNDFIHHHNHPPGYQSWLTLCLGIAFYFSGFFHRMVTAVMADQLMADFNIGAASMGVAWVSILKLSTRWFKSSQFAVVTGLALCLGILGALSAGVPLRLLMNLFGWRWIIFGAGTITLIISLAIWIFVRDDPVQKGYDSYATDITTSSTHGFKTSSLSDLSNVFRYKNTWILTIVPASLIGPALAFAGL